MKKPAFIHIIDTTLRDGEQCPGANLGLPEKLQIARQLEKLNVDTIEAGFPAASPGEAEAVRQIAATIKKCRISALSRCLPADIEQAARALEPAGDRACLHLFISTSPIHRRDKLRMAKSDVLRAAVSAVRHARDLGLRVQFSAEDATRTELSFLASVLRAVLEAGASILNIPDTVGYTVPDEFRRLLTFLRTEIPPLRRAALHVHCHNDLGLAVANSLAALESGATGVECTLNGIGERAGNCALEELVMALRVRSGLYALQTRIRSTEIYPASRLVSRLTGIPVQPNKAIVGANAFSHEAGVHQDGILKNPATYEIMSPADVGRTPTELVLGRHSGRAGFSAHLHRMGIRLDSPSTLRLYDSFLALADKKKSVYDDDIIELLREHLSDIPRVYTIRRLQVSAGNQTIPTATLQLEKDGKTLQDSATGAGPVEAALKAIERITQAGGELKSFAMQSVTHGEDALGEATVQVRFGTSLITAKGSDIDIVMAAAKAYVNALNRHLCLTPAPA